MKVTKQQIKTLVEMTAQNLKLYNLDKQKSYTTLIELQNQYLQLFNLTKISTSQYFDLDLIFAEYKIYYEQNKIYIKQEEPMQSQFLEQHCFPLPQDYYVLLLLLKNNFQLSTQNQAKFCLDLLFDYRVHVSTRLQVLQLVTNNQNFQVCTLQITQKIVDGLDSKYFDKYQREVIPYIEVFPYLFGSENNQTDNILRLIDNQFDVIDRHVLKNVFCASLAFALQRNQQDLKISNFIQKKIDKIHTWLNNKKHFHTTFILLVEHSVRSRDYMSNPNFQKLLLVMKQNPIQAMPYFVRLCLFYCFKRDIFESSAQCQDNIKEVYYEQWLQQLPDMFNLLTKGKEQLKIVQSAMYQLVQYDFNLLSDIDQHEIQFLKKAYFQVYPFIGLLSSKSQSLYLEFISFARLLFEAHLPYFIDMFSENNIKQETKFLFDTVIFTLPSNQNTQTYFLEELYQINPQIYAASVFQKTYSDVYADILIKRKQNFLHTSFDKFDQYTIDLSLKWIISDQILSDVPLKFYSNMLLDLRRTKSSIKVTKCIQSLLMLTENSKFIMNNLDFEYTLILIYLTDYINQSDIIQENIQKIVRNYVSNCRNYKGLFVTGEFKQFFKSVSISSQIIQKTQNCLLLQFIQEQLLIDIQQQDQINFSNMVLIYSFMRQFNDLHKITEISQKNFDNLYQYSKTIFSTKATLLVTKSFINKLFPVVDIPKSIILNITTAINFRKNTQIMVQNIKQMQIQHNGSLFSTILMDIAKNSTVSLLTDRIFIRLLVFQIIQEINIFDLSEQFVSSLQTYQTQDYTNFLQSLFGQQNIILLFIGISLVIQKIDNSDEINEILSILSFPFLVVLTYIPDLTNKLQKQYQQVDLTKIDFNQIFQNLLSKKQLLKDSNVCQLILTFISQQRFKEILMQQLLKKQIINADILQCNSYVLQSVFNNNHSLLEFVSDLTPGEIHGYLKGEKISNFDPVYIKHRFIKLNYVFQNSFNQKFNLILLLQSFTKENLLQYQQEQFEQYIYMIVNAIANIQQFNNLLSQVVSTSLNVKESGIELFSVDLSTEDIQYEISFNQFQQEAENQYNRIQEFINIEKQTDIYKIIFNIIKVNLEDNSLNFLSQQDFDIELDLTQLFIYYEQSAPQNLVFSYQQIHLIIDYLISKDLIDIAYLDQRIFKYSYQQRADLIFQTTLNKIQIQQYFSLCSFLSLVLIISSNQKYLSQAAAILQQLFICEYFQPWNQYLKEATNMNVENNLSNWILSFSNNIPILCPGITMSLSQIMQHNKNKLNQYHEKVIININESFYKTFFTLEQRSTFQIMPHTYCDNSKTCSDHFDNQNGPRDDSMIQDIAVDNLRNIALSELFLAQLLELLGNSNSLTIFKHFISFLLKNSLNIENTIDKLTEVYCNNKTFLSHYNLSNDFQLQKLIVLNQKNSINQKRKNIAKSQSFFAKSDDVSDTSISKKATTATYKFQSELINTDFDFKLIDKIILCLSYVLAEPILKTLIKFTYHRDIKNVNTNLIDIIMMKEQQNEFIYGFAARIFIANILQHNIKQGKIQSLDDQTIYTSFSILLTKGNFTEISNKLLQQSEDDDTNTTATSSSNISSHMSSNTSKIVSTTVRDSTSILPPFQDGERIQIQFSLPTFHFLDIAFDQKIVSDAQFSQCLQRTYEKTHLINVALLFARQVIYFNIDYQFQIPWINADKFIDIQQSEYAKQHILYSLPQILTIQSLNSLENRFILLENIYELLKLFPTRPTEQQLGQLTTEVLFVYVNQILINEFTSIQLVQKTNKILDQIVFALALIAANCDHTKTLQNLIILFKLLMMSDFTMKTAYYLYDIFQQFINIERFKPLWLQILQIIQAQTSLTIIKFWNYQLVPLQSYVTVRKDFQFATAPQSFQQVFSSQMETVKQWEANLRIRNRETDQILSQLKQNERPQPSKIFTVYLEECIKSSVEDIRKYLGEKFETMQIIKQIAQCGSQQNTFLPIIKLKFKFSQAQLKTMIIVHLISMMVYRIQHKNTYLSQVLHSLILLFRISVQNKTIQPDDKMHDVQRIINLFTCQEEREELCLDKKYDCKTLLADLGVVLNKEFFAALLELIVFEPYQTACTLLLVTSARSLGPQFLQFNYLLSDCQRKVTQPHCKQILKDLCAKLFISGEEMQIQYNRGAGKQLSQFKIDFFGD